MPRKVFKTQQQYEEKMNSLNTTKKSNYGVFADGILEIPTVQNKKAEFYRILGVPQNEKHLYSVTPKEFKKAITTFFKNCTLEELMDPNNNDIAAVDSQMKLIAEGLLFDLIGGGDIKKAMPCFFKEETNSLLYNSDFVTDFQDVIDKMASFRPNDEHLIENSALELLYEDKIQGDVFLRCAERTENALPALDNHGRFLQGYDIHEENNYKAFTDELWNYRELQQLHTSRSIFWKIIHPFKNRDEKQALSQIKESFVKRGVSGEKLDDYALNRTTEIGIPSTLANQIAERVEKEALEDEVSAKKWQVNLQGAEMAGRNFFEEKKQEISTLLDFHLDKSGKYKITENNLEPMNKTFDKVGHDLALLFQIANERANPNSQVNSRDMLAGVPTDELTHFLEHTLDNIHTMFKDHFSVNQPMENIQKGIYNEGDFKNATQFILTDYINRLNRNEDVVDYWKGARPINDFNLEKYTNQLDIDDAEIEGPNNNIVNNEVIEDEEEELVINTDAPSQNM